jgi:hypothetical protein
VYGYRETRGLVRENDIACARQAHPVPGGRAVHRHYYWCAHPGEALDSAVKKEVHALEMGWQMGWLLRREGLQIAAGAENPSGTGQQHCTHNVAFVAFARDFFEFLS